MKVSAPVQCLPVYGFNFKGKNKPRCDTTFTPHTMVAHAMRPGCDPHHCNDRRLPNLVVTDDHPRRVVESSVHTKVRRLTTKQLSLQAKTMRPLYSYQRYHSPKKIWNAHVTQPRNIEISQPMSPKRSLQVSTYWLLHRQGSVMRTMMKAGSTINLVRSRGRMKVEW